MSHDNVVSLLTHTRQVHMAFMLGSLFVGLVGVALVFIGHAHEDNPRGLIELGSNNVSEKIFPN